MKTYTAKAADMKHGWRLVDASGKSLGRLASEVAQILKGKDKPIYTPNQDTGDYVVIVNATGIVMSQERMEQKFYYRHSGYAHGFRKVSQAERWQKEPTRVVEDAIRGMLPRNRLGEAMYRKLKVYGGAEHPHTAQLGNAQAVTVQEDK
jgi:large subunit ribosomal protein L13